MKNEIRIITQESASSRLAWLQQYRIIVWMKLNMHIRLNLPLFRKIMTHGALNMTYTHTAE